MNSPNEDEEESFYQVPPPARLNVQDKLPSSEVPPPVLMPKKGSSFRESSALLDRAVPVVTPRPRPRLSSHRKSSVNSAVMNESGDFQDLKCASQPGEAVPNDAAVGNSPFVENVAQKHTEPEKSTPSPAPRPVPKPRPRTKMPLPSLQNISQDLSVPISQTLSHSSPSIPDKVEDSSLTRRLTQSVNGIDPVNEEAESERPYSISIPFPSADNLELMLNSEVDKKYGLTSTCSVITSEKMDTSSLQSKISSSNLYGNIADVRSLDNKDDEDEYVNTDSIKSSFNPISHNNEAADQMSPPKPHSLSETHPYLPMRTRSKSEKISEYCPQLTQNSPSSDVKLKLDLDDDDLGESSTDFPLESAMESTAHHIVNPTTPKPFDIQPFKSDIASAFDFSEFDPLWMNKSKEKTSQVDFLEKQSVDVCASQAQAVEQNKIKSDPAFSEPTVTYVLKEEEEPTGTHYSQINQMPSDTAQTVRQKPLHNRLSFHHAAPSAPPPPFPREQNRVPEPKPPPVPPRPANAASPHGSSTSVSSDNADFFKGLPTPLFTSQQENDPFQDSSFSNVCQDFNTSRVVPLAQHIAPLPRVPISKMNVSLQDNSAAVADADPHRISSFVIPPPNTQGNEPDEGYELAKEVSDSDSETIDSALVGSVYGWQPGGPLPASQVAICNGPLSTKKTNTRCGYLCKQGGYKANKGWKKRWVVFNGTSLSYYTNNISQVSKRIIPVECISNVEHDIKANDKNSFKFKVVTTLRDRVFIFSSESLDDCLTWANTLMAAVTENKRPTTTTENPPDKPDKQGFIKFSNMKRYYATITGKMFCYYQSFEDFQMGSPIHEIDMKLGSVKMKDHKKLQLWIHYGHFDLTFESDQEMQQWRLAMEDAIAEGLADDTVLNKVYENLSNQLCADCMAENPHWASINLGIVVCKNCAGIHRMFDYRVSKIRSLRMDTRVWTPSLIELMVTIGNANANAYWEFELPAGAKISSAETMEKRKEFINKKYMGKKFCNLHPLASQGPVLSEELLKISATDRVLEAMKILFSGADVLYRQDRTSASAYEIAKEHGQRLIMELLYQNGGDPQAQTDDAKDENRQREDVRLQGFLNKTGPVGRTFERRWCILEHGALTYYLNEKSVTFKGSIGRKDMLLIQTVDTDRIGYPFEISTQVKDNRIFTFSSDCKDDSGEWVRTIAKLMAPLAVMDHVGMIDIRLAGYAYLKESFVDEWHETFIVFSWRGINYMNRDLKFDYLDLRKASTIKMQDSSSGFQQKGPCFVISSTGRSMYLQASLPRDTEKMFAAFIEAIRGSGPTLIDQALTNENVPVIVDRCITHIYMNGLEEKGIYRTAGVNSRVQALLDEFRRDAWSVSLNDYTVQDVANALKRFLRELDDSVFERINYGSWISMAGCKEESNRLRWYKYYLEKMPQVNFQTLKRIVLHLLEVSQKENVNLMTVQNLASCFAPSLLRIAKDEQPNLTSDSASKEISIMVDLINKSDYFFNVNETEKLIQDNIRKAEIEIQRKMIENRKSAADPTAVGILTPVHLLSRVGQSINILVTEDKTAKEATEYLKRNKSAPDLCIYVLHELLFKGVMERPMFPDDIIASTTNRWIQWESWVMEDNNVCLCVVGTDLLEKLNSVYNPCHVLLSRLQYCEGKPRSKFKRKMVGFRQCKLAVYSDSQGNNEAMSWNVEDIVIYLGTQHRKALPSKYCLTFLVNGEKYSKPPFGHTLSFDTEDEMYRWAAAMYVAQHPKGLLSWAS